MKNIYPLKNQIQHYPWGSPTAIPALLRQDASPDLPCAEMWMGVHPRGASKVKGEGSLFDLLERDLPFFLGPSVAERYQGLPFLFKVLAADSPLSIQVHPSKKEAEEGWNRETRRGVPLEAPFRNYRDKNHKPEIVCALTEFWALKGFRSPLEIYAQLRSLSLPSSLQETLLNPLQKDSETEALEAFYHSLMHLSDEDKKDLLAHLAACLESDQTSESLLWSKRLCIRYPGDIGVLAPFYLNVVRLAPGEALFLPAKELHAYLEGTAVELMASSDNVLRGGLTTKHQDREELLRVVCFHSTSPKSVEPRLLSEQEKLFPTKAEEFELAQIILNQGNRWQLPRNNPPQIVLVTEGSLRFESPEKEKWFDLAQGESFFIPFDAGPWRLSGEGSLYSARARNGA